jgi:hypothetical protein
VTVAHDTTPAVFVLELGVRFKDRLDFSLDHLLQHPLRSPCRQIDRFSSIVQNRCLRRRDIQMGPKVSTIDRAHLRPLSRH